MFVDILRIIYLFFYFLTIISFSHRLFIHLHFIILRLLFLHFFILLYFHFFYSFVYLFIYTYQ